MCVCVDVYLSIYVSLCVCIIYIRDSMNGTWYLVMIDGWGIVVDGFVLVVTTTTHASHDAAISNARTNFNESANKMRFEHEYDVKCFFMTS